jgi:hypothetical protein
MTIKEFLNTEREYLDSCAESEELIVIDFKSFLKGGI